MAYTAVIVEGGLFSADFLERLGATPDELPGQKPIEFKIESTRLSDEIQSAFSDARAYWAAFQHRLRRGKESATTITREQWVIPLLETLGYDLTYQRAAIEVGGARFAISHRGGEPDDAPPVHIVAADQKLDARGDARMSPHALVQDYLNRTDPLWGLVTNGRQVRLLRDTARLAKPTFVEFDLEAMVEGNLYSEFVLFYRLVHRTRLPLAADDAHECWLEQYYQQGIDAGGRVRDHLRDGVEKALETLGTGFLAHPDSGGLRDAIASKRLDEIGYYRELLRLIYRLLFLMVAEERKLLLVPSAETAARQEIYTQWYSIGRLRDRVDRRLFDDPHSDLWEGLKQTFRLFRDGATAAQLGLTALDGELFGVLACIERGQAKLGNAELLDALFHLSTFEEITGRRRRSGIRRRVNYAGLDVEELGSVYESLLDFHPYVSLDPPKFELVAGSERKTTGSYYTPRELVAELIESALVPVVEERLGAAETDAEKETALLDLKVCDPASGSGHFLLAAARRIGRELAKVRTREAEPAPAAYRQAVRDVIRHCIYAVDKNPLAVDLCKVALWIEGHEAGLPLSFLDHHVKCGDSLIGVFDLRALAEGIPDDAYKALTDDDKETAKTAKKRNKAERQRSLFKFTAEEDLKVLAGEYAALADIAETTADEVQVKERLYRSLRDVESRWQRVKDACDLWCAAFFTPLKPQAPIPTTRAVWDRLAGAAGSEQGPLAAAADTIAEESRFFHWPLQFPEVFIADGFDVALGNPPWERIKLQEQEFFAAKDAAIANAPNKAAREKLIQALPAKNPALAAAFAAAKRTAEAAGVFIREAGRYPLTATGDINTYAVFAETFLRLIGEKGRAGFIVPTGIATDDTTKAYFNEIVSSARLASLNAFENEEFIFPGVHNSFRFGLLTLRSPSPGLLSDFSFFARRPEQLADQRRHFTLSQDDIALINPNTRTCPIFRSQTDADLTKKIYARVPVLIDESKGEIGNPWRMQIRRLFDMGKAEVVGLCRRTHALGFIRMYEAKMIHQFDHRWSGYFSTEVATRYHDVVRSKHTRKPSRIKTDPATIEAISYTTPLELKQNPKYDVDPFYWISDSELHGKLATTYWDQDWILCWRDIASAHVFRSVIAAVIPRCGTDFTIRVNVGFYDEELPYGALLANLNSLVLDFVARQKIGGTHLADFVMKQLPVLPPFVYGQAALASIIPRVLELTYTAWDLQPFARYLGYDGAPFAWDPDRRALLRAELDAYYAYLYDLSRDELRYILDPADVIGEGFPSQTFRLLKQYEIRDFGEYRTRRLVLEAYDRFAEDGTFDPARLSDARYFETVKAALTTTKAQLSELERTYQSLVARADADKRPTLFVEGTTDAAIIAAAWAAVFPGAPQPFQVLAAEGTKNMGSLAGKGKALREILGQRLVFALADNDFEGRSLWDNKAFREGGQWRQHENGIWWCALKPTDDFRALMAKLKVDPGFWPFSIEACFPPALRRQAAAEGAWWFSDDIQSDLMRETGLARRMFKAAKGLTADDDAAYYLLAPHYQAKNAFAAWVTAPERLTKENYAAFEPVLIALRALIEKHGRCAGVREKIG